MANRDSCFVMSATMVGVAPDGCKEALAAALHRAAERLASEDCASYSAQIHYKGEVVGNLIVSVFNP